MTSTTTTAAPLTIDELNARVGFPTEHAQHNGFVLTRAYALGRCGKQNGRLGTSGDKVHLLIVERVASKPADADRRTVPVGGIYAVSGCANNGQRNGTPLAGVVELARVTCAKCRKRLVALGATIAIDAAARDRALPANDECPKCSRIGAGPLCKDHRPAADAWEYSTCAALDFATSERRRCYRRCTKPHGHDGEHVMSAWSLSSPDVEAFAAAVERRRAHAALAAQYPNSTPDERDDMIANPLPSPSPSVRVVVQYDYYHPRQEVVVTWNAEHGRTEAQADALAAHIRRALGAIGGGK